MDETKSIVFVFSSGRTGARHRANLRHVRVAAAVFDRQRMSERL
jgi:hypothetical protein